MRPECLKRLIGLQVAIVVALVTTVLVTFFITDFQNKNTADDAVSDPTSTSSPHHSNSNVGSIETNYSSISISGSKGIDYDDVYNTNNRTLNITQGEDQEKDEEESITAANGDEIMKTIDLQQPERTEEEAGENNDNDVISGIFVENGDEIDENDTIVLEVEEVVEMDLTANDNVVVSSDSLSKEESLPSSYSRGIFLPEKTTERVSDIHQNKQIPEYFTSRKKPGRSSTAITPPSPSSSSSSSPSQLLPSPSNRTEVSVDYSDDNISNVPSDGPSHNPSSVPTRSPSNMPSDYPSLSPNLFSDKPSDGTISTGAPSKAILKLINPTAVPISSLKSVSSSVPSDGPSLSPSTTPTSVPIDSCPNNAPLGKGCNGFEENLNCGYNYIYTGCTFDVLACVPSVTCICLPGGDWSCDGIFEQPCWGLDSDPEIVEGECDPNAYLPTSAAISSTSTNLPTIDVSTSALTVTTGPTSSLSPTSKDVPTSSLPTQAVVCPINYKPDAVCSASINNRDCKYDYVYMGCSWNFLICGPTVECSCESPYGKNDGIWSCVEKKYGSCGLRRHADLPPLGESCNPYDDISRLSSPPSDSPTTSPSDSPTSSPTQSPTTSPSDSPTMSPTDSPTSSPTQSPTTSPSDPPSDTSLLETISVTDALSTECPLSLKLGKCAEFQENLQCSYSHIYHGCTWDALTCLPSVTCDCQQGNWFCTGDFIKPCAFCTGDFIKPCEIDQGISPDEGLPWGEECDPNEVIPQEIIVSTSPSITPPTDLPTLVASVVPTPRNYDDRLIKECPDTFQLGSCGNEYVDDLECDYNYVYIGCTWEDLTCSPSVSCRCDGNWECQADFVNCYSDNPLLLVPDDLPWGETCDPEQALTLPTR